MLNGGFKEHFLVPFVPILRTWLFLSRKCKAQSIIRKQRLIGALESAAMQDQKRAWGWEGIPW